VPDLLLSDHGLDLLQRLIHDETGILIPDSKRSLIVGRLAGRLRELGLPSFLDYYRLVRDGEAERTQMLDRIVTNETRFFREPKQFDFLQQRAFPDWEAAAAGGRRPRRIRVWSAACSTGEEPYSVAMVLLARFPPSSGWEVEVLATDVSTRALARAEQAIWPLARATEIPRPHLTAFMLRGRGAEHGRMKASSELRRVVRFARVNLNASRYPVGGPFELVLCRNVLIYFDSQTRAEVVARLVDHLAGDGLLLLGQAEGLTGRIPSTRSVGPAVFAHTSAAGRWDR
jgi:chemotaxis protein methyltransferase CheR